MLLSFVQAHAPGSLMLLGEHAVLHDRQALVCAIDKRICVSLKPRTDNRIEITSALGQLHTDINQLEIQKPFEFVLCALQRFKLQNGFDLHIESEFSDKVGLGSSAAVTVATLAVMMNWLEIPFTPLEMVKHGREVVRQIQGVGSGADVAASVYGGVVSYLANPLQVEKIPVLLPLHAIYAGYKTPTVQVIHHVQQYFSSQPVLFEKICDEIGGCAKQGKQFIHEADWKKLGEVMNTQQTWMEALQVSSPFLQAMITDLRKQAGILGAKISGSGLGDCVIALGALPDEYQCCVEDKILQRIPVAMTLQGVELYCEKN